MNRIQAVDAANVIMHIRPDWQQAGIIAVLLQLDLTYPAAILHSVKVAANPNSRNPGAITATPQTVERRSQRDDDNAQLARIRLADDCPHCDPRGYLPNGAICHHEPPEAAAERAHRGAALARAALGLPERPTVDQPWLPADLAAESAARLATDEHRKPEEDVSA